VSHKSQLLDCFTTMLLGLTPFCPRFYPWGTTIPQVLYRATC